MTTNSPAFQAGLTTSCHATNSGQAKGLGSKVVDRSTSRWVPGLLALLLWVFGAFFSAWAATSDFNGDGKTDIVWRGPNGEVGIWSMSGSTMQSAAIVSTIPMSWTIVGVGDFNGDGKPDMLWRGPNGEVGIWLMNGSTMQSAAVVSTVPTNWGIAGVGDFNGDGKADILWRGPNGEVGIWLMNGSTMQSAVFVSPFPTNWSIVGVADFNGDGKADILGRGPTGEVGIWLMNGSTIQSSTVVSTIPMNWLMAGLGDFNGDGKADILWRGPNGEVNIWFMNGTTQSSAVVSTVPMNWTIAGLGDFNGGGKADILWRGPNGEVGIWLMNDSTMQSAVVVATPPLSWTVAGGPQTYTLSTSATGYESGSVLVLSPVGRYSPTGTVYTNGTVVTLHASPAPGTVFAGWSGACSGSATTCLVTMNANVAVSATFIIPSTISTWSGTYNYYDPSDCFFSGSGTLTVTLPSTGGSGPASMNGIQIREVGNPATKCAILDNNATSTGFVTAAISGNNISGVYNGNLVSIVHLISSTVSVSFVGTISGNTMSGTLSDGYSLRGTFSLTKH